MFYKCPFHIKLRNWLSVCIPVKKPVTANGDMGQNKRTNRNIRLNCSWCSNPEKSESFMFLFRLSCFQVDVCKSIQFVNYYVNIVCTYSCRQYSNSFPFVFTCYSNKLSWRADKLFAFKERWNKFNSSSSGFICKWNIDPSLLIINSDDGIWLIIEFFIYKNKLYFIHLCKNQSYDTTNSITISVCCQCYTWYPLLFGYGSEFTGERSICKLRSSPHI